MAEDLDSLIEARCAEMFEHVIEQMGVDGVLELTIASLMDDESLGISREDAKTFIRNCLAQK